MIAMECIGNSTKDAVMRVTQAGKNVCSFTVAVNDRRDKDKTTFVKCTAWNKLADVCAKYVRKGMKLYVHGEPDVQTYETKNGETRTDLCIIANDVEFLSRVENTDNSSEQYNEQSEPEQNVELTPVDEDELPF